MCHWLICKYFTVNKQPAQWNTLLAAVPSGQSCYWLFKHCIASNWYYLPTGTHTLPRCRLFKNCHTYILIYFKLDYRQLVDEYFTYTTPRFITSVYYNRSVCILSFVAHWCFCSMTKLYLSVCVVELKWIGLSITLLPLCRQTAVL